MTRPDVLEAMEEARGRPSAVLNRLKHLYGLTDQQIGDALGMVSPEVQVRRTGKRGFTPAQLAGFARFFGLPVEVFFMTPAEAVRMAIERDPDLVAPHLGPEVSRAAPSGRGDTIE